jgi:hypothetical protein
MNEVMAVLWLSQSVCTTWCIRFPARWSGWS